MKKIIRSKISFYISLVGFIGGVVWAANTKYDPEAIILIIVSLLEIVGYLALPEAPEIREKNQKIKTEQNVNVSVNFGQAVDRTQQESLLERQNFDRATILNTMSSKTSILFIDDDSKFNVVKILKDSGWKNTKTVTDIKTLDVPVVKNADIIFVDINGVGQALNLEYEGLDLVLMLKQKYPQKKVIIYSANRNSNSFHRAWDVCDFKLEKNALPYQFQNLVEEYSIKLYNQK